MCAQNCSLCLESKLENNPVENATTVSALLSQGKIDTGENKCPGNTLKVLFRFHSGQGFFFVSVTEDYIHYQINLLLTIAYVFQMCDNL